MSYDYSSDFFYHVPGGSIDAGSRRRLPRSAKNVSNIWNLSEQAIWDGHEWAKEVKIGDDPYDSTTHVKEGPALALNGITVEATYTIRAKTAQELADELQARVDSFSNNTQLFGIIGLLVKQNFHLENRVITLEGGTPYPVTLVGAQAWIDDSDALTGLPQAKLEKLIELFS